MTPLDRFLERWRIRKARDCVKGKSVLDIGAREGVLHKLLPGIRFYFGIDPQTTAESRKPDYNLVRGLFPQQVPADLRFDVITLFAVLEHIPEAEQIPLARNCFVALNSGGHLIITVPSPVVDIILDVLSFLQLTADHSIVQHYGYDIRKTPELFGSAGFRLVKWEKFQLGLNNLFVFQKP